MQFDSQLIWWNFMNFWTCNNENIGKSLQSLSLLCARKQAKNNRRFDHTNWIIRPHAFGRLRWWVLIKTKIVLKACCLSCTKSLLSDDWTGMIKPLWFCNKYISKRYIIRKYTQMGYILNLSLQNQVITSKVEKYKWVINF